MNKRPNLDPIPGSMRFPTPKYHLEDWLKLILSSQRDRLVVVYHPQDDVRIPVLTKVANDIGAACLVAEKYRTNKQFLVALNRVRGLSVKGTGYDLLQRLLDNPGAIWIEKADLLRHNMLNKIRSIYDQAGGPILLSSSDYSLVDNTDDRDAGGQWYSRRFVYDW